MYAKYKWGSCALQNWQQNTLCIHTKCTQTSIDKGEINRNVRKMSTKSNIKLKFQILIT